MLRIQDLLSAVNVYALKESVREGSHNGFWMFTNEDFTAYRIEVSKTGTKLSRLL